MAHSIDDEAASNLGDTLLAASQELVSFVLQDTTMAGKPREQPVSEAAGDLVLKGTRY